MPRTPSSSRRDVEMGAPSPIETGIAAMKPATMRARCEGGNQYVKYRIMPGKKPASASPRRKRRVKKLTGPLMNAEITDEVEGAASRRRQSMTARLPLH